MGIEGVRCKGNVGRKGNEELRVVELKLSFERIECRDEYGIGR